MNNSRENAVGPREQAVVVEAALPMPRLGTAQVIGSTLAAVFGVQSRENKIRDFEHGHIGQFIAAGLLFTAVFVGGMIALVNLIA